MSTLYVISSTISTFTVEKKLKKKTFLNKNGWTAASYDVILVTKDTDYHQTCLKTRARDKRTATKN